MDQSVPYAYAPPPVPKAQDPYYIRDKRRNLSRLGFALLIFEAIVILAQVLLEFICSTWFPGFTAWSDYTLALSSVTQYAIGFPVLLIMAAGIPKERPEKSRMKADQWIVFLAVSFFLMIAGSYLADALTSALSFLRGEAISDSVSEMIENSSPIGNLITVCVLAPVFEELIYRKLVIDRLLPCGEVLAVVTSGILFGLVHGNFYQFFYAALLGMLFGFVYVRTGRLIYTIGMHMIINFVGSFMTDFFNEMLDKPNPAWYWSFTEKLFTFSIYLLALFGLILLIVRRKDFRMKKEGSLELPVGRQFQITWVNPGMMIFNVFCALMLLLSIFI